MRRDYRVYLEDILEASRKIERYVTGLSPEQFMGNSMTADAVIRNLEIIGEAAKRLPEEVRSRCPEIPWREIIGLRNFATHQYFGIKLEVIWDTVQNELPVLERAVEKLLSEEGPYEKTHVAVSICSVVLYERKPIRLRHNAEQLCPRRYPRPTASPPQLFPAGAIPAPSPQTR